MVFGLCPAGTEFYGFTKNSFELLRGYILQKYSSHSLAQLFGTIPDLNHPVVIGKTDPPAKLTTGKSDHRRNWPQEKTDNKNDC